MTSTHRSVDYTKPAQLDMAGLSYLLFSHAAFQYLRAACELNLFETITDLHEPTKEKIRTALGLEERATDILLLGVTSLGMLTKDNGIYRNAEVLEELMSTADWQRFKDTVAFEQYIVYESQLDFTESLRANNNVGLRRFPGTGRDLYHRMHQHPELEKVFYKYMRSWSELANKDLIKHLDLSNTHRLLDAGGGDAVNALALAQANPHLHVTLLDIESALAVPKSKIAAAGLGDRVEAKALDILHDPFPTGYDCILFAHQLVIWTLEENIRMLRKAYDALPKGGRVVIFNSMSNDEGDGPVVAALDSVYFACLPAEGGMIYSWEQYEHCLNEAGFKDPQRIRIPGWTPHGIIIAHK
ncbi:MULTISPECIES: methyltransferase [Xenorhabdus]|uniref:Methyltransferase family protein n=1 Tax=Xenorhabdus ehlersii TaxID=290111 RepID=A0A2D0IUU6_9GAMM|nr:MULTISPECIES: methyltransferase [Xenorhabdus]MBC8950430.1 QbsJ [Xenorhabdus sp. TS4]PHM25651.1 QbsJ [Xenorhabdus ehlersii]RKE93480.1 methyltransferase family protein [Xenorhabdus ehlersii]